MGKRNNSQRKENVESPRKEISENEACNMTEKEFRVMVMEFIHRMDEKINNLCKNQEEMKSDIATIKNTMESFNSRLQEAEDRISELEDQVQKQAQAEQQLEKKIKKQEESLRELRDNMKRSNMRIIGLPEGQEEQQGLENLFEEIMTENFPDMGKIKVKQVKRVPSRINPKRPTPRHVIISMANINDKERILKAARERQRVTYKGTPIRLSNDYSSETQQARSEWKEVYKVLQSKGLNPRILYPARLSIKIEGEIRSFADKKRLREFITTKPAMQELLKGILHLLTYHCNKIGIAVITKDFRVVKPNAPLSALAFRSDLLLDHYGEVPSTVTASSEPKHQIQFSLKYCRTEDKTSEDQLSPPSHSQRAKGSGGGGGLRGHQQRPPCRSLEAPLPAPSYAGDTGLQNPLFLLPKERKKRLQIASFCYPYNLIQKLEAQCTDSCTSGVPQHVLQGSSRNQLSDIP
ncbi:hypothetical protein QTO34_014669 [Cnephaeus nilssonii]|uniref:L1 transposable element RRM domain-containing protein n=1 Tax=Cnephaeus nilssonii TaxID=3371016 RepID=A0AA40I6U2_CNENI|nr:hypothetical protein QTO34_014669 [Eptesicus nilssonii]